MKGCAYVVQGLLYKRFIAFAECGRAAVLFPVREVNSDDTAPRACIESKRERRSTQICSNLKHQVRFLCGYQAAHIPIRSDIPASVPIEMIDRRYLDRRLLAAR